MGLFSNKIRNFLVDASKDEDIDVSIVTRSISAARPGDILFFRYEMLRNRDFRVVMAVSPVVRDAATGNLLLTCFKLPEDQVFNQEELDNLYNQRAEDFRKRRITSLTSLIAQPMHGYRTYILTKGPGNNVWGNIYRIRKTPREVLRQ
jgi:hypothetical protein